MYLYAFFKVPCRYKVTVMGRFGLFMHMSEFSEAYAASGVWLA